MDVCMFVTPSGKNCSTDLYETLLQHRLYIRIIHGLLYNNTTIHRDNQDTRGRNRLQNLVKKINNTNIHFNQQLHGQKQK